MKRFAFAALALLVTGSARAESRDDAPRRPTTVTPTAGVVAGTWMSLPVVRGALGVDVRRRWTESVGANLTFLAELGQTLEGGLGNHRAELGGAVSIGGERFELALGLHLSYALLVRITGSAPDQRARGGNIDGIGLGPQLAVSGAIPIAAGKYALTYGLRSSFDVFVSGVGWEVGPTFGVRF